VSHSRLALLVSRLQKETSPDPSDVLQASAPAFDGLILSKSSTRWKKTLVCLIVYKCDDFPLHCQSITITNNHLPQTYHSTGITSRISQNSSVQMHSHDVHKAPATGVDHPNVNCLKHQHRSPVNCSNTPFECDNCDELILKYPCKYCGRGEDA
jgi:hypothetical protein